MRRDDPQSKEPAEGRSPDALRMDPQRPVTSGTEVAPGHDRHGTARNPANDAPYRLIADVDFGENVVVSPFTNLYGCRIGDETRVGPFVEIQRDAVVGARCKIQSHCFICTGVEIQDEVFVGHGTMFINDKFPRATTEAGALKTDADWLLMRTVVERGAALGSGVLVLGGIRIGAGALVGAGAVVTRDVAPGETVAGVPARVRERR
jgi:UDP-2-acetamido-3-amino-2,3-dideoxy-glucuronate N-acetyltransferase